MAAPLLSEAAIGDAPVLRLLRFQPTEADPGAAWHLCGIGVKEPVPDQ
jgi:hypothetical protein